MIYPIYIYGSGVLRKECEEIGPDYPELGKLIEDMYATMYASDGVGLAAPQIGKDIRLFVVDASGFADIDPTAKDFKKVFINPEIVAKDDTLVAGGEGCLSVPEIYDDVERSQRITLRYYDSRFTPQEEIIEGFTAVIFQHEIDHLDGIVYKDRITK